MARIVLCVWVLGIAFACSDPDVVPSTHISAPPKVEISPTAKIQEFPLRTALFGDLHVHTSWSGDAYAGGNRLGPNSAYRFAQGEAITLPGGAVVQLETPLDFVALTDHAEGFGTHLACTLADGQDFDLPRCRDLRSGALDQEAMLEQAFAIAGTRPMPRDAEQCADLAYCQANERSTWQRVQELANAHNDPGKFTALIGYEFSALLDQFGMLHRNVLFRGTDVTPHAISALDVTNQSDFFAQLDAACVAPCDVLTIPHNTNYSWGLTFSRSNEDGGAYTAEDLERRSRIERVFEITQQKGNSECMLGVGATDEDCNFGNLFPACQVGQDARCIKARSMYRNVLLDGLNMGADTGLNPFKLGVIGSTDTHASDPGNTRGEVPGQLVEALGSKLATWRVLDLDHVVVGPIRKLSQGGLAGVWAVSNTRADVFDALQRREAFATSGSRLRIRFFAGDFAADAEEMSLQTAYDRGVPMGAEAPNDQIPRFWVWASKDPAGAALDRIQIIKGWHENGEAQQRVWDVVCSGGRQPDAHGKCPGTTASVDLASCATTGDSGSVELQATFTDEDFRTDAASFYYVRVFEDPSCRWTTRMANAAGLDRPDDVAGAVQQRGWSSPIWFGR